jgi:hypothetical protein
MYFLFMVLFILHCFNYIFYFSISLLLPISMVLISFLDSFTIISPFFLSTILFFSERENVFYKIVLIMILNSNNKPH